MMWGAFIWTLLICGTVYAGANLTINQSPQRITVTEGGSAHLNCSWNEIVVGFISWYKDVKIHDISNTSTWYGGRVRTFSSQSVQMVVLYITDLKMNDSGWYYCQMNIFQASTFQGNGTELTVIPSGSQKSVTYLLVILPLVVGLIVLMLVMILYIKHRRRSPDKELRTQAVNKEEDRSENITYANLKIRKLTSNRSPHYSKGKPATSQGQRIRKEEEVTYAVVNVWPLKS
ncbi:uncharacterized protein [Narcine bancroftii]|uniref:uncharacterized protein n=1 Tax=Narcine bancroftii TaxID=1343680 RepID=UPI0038316DBC